MKIQRQDWERRVSLCVLRSRVESGGKPLTPTLSPSDGAREDVFRSLRLSLRCGLSLHCGLLLNHEATTDLRSCSLAPSDGERVRVRGKQRAFSLLEILCAVLILGVALTGLVQGVTVALSSSKESELQTVAALFAAGQIETLRAEGDIHDGTSDGDCGEGLSLYRWQQTITSAGIDGLHEVSVVVENAKSGKSIYELRTLLFEVPDDSRAKSSTTKRDSNTQRRRNGGR